MNMTQNSDWRKEKNATEESSEGEVNPEIKLDDFARTAKQVMVNTGVHRHPSVQVRGPG